MKQYKVWVHVEECDEDNDHYEDIGLPECIDVFSSLEAAEDCVNELCGGYQI